MSHSFIDRAAPLLYAMQRAHHAATGAAPVPEWADAPEFRRKGAVNGVLAILATPEDHGVDACDAMCRAAVLALAPDEELLAARHAGGVPGGRIVAEHLVDTYGIAPVIAQDGALSLHFERLGVSVEVTETLQTQSEFFTDMAARTADPAGLRRWRQTLSAELAKADAALAAGVQ